MGISARAISLADRPQRAMWVTRVRMRREDRSSISFLVLSQTSAGKTFRRLALRSRGLNPDCLECSTMSQDAPSNAGELVGERDGEDVVMQSLLRCFDPRLEGDRPPCRTPRSGQCRGACRTVLLEPPVHGVHAR